MTNPSGGGDVIAFRLPWPPSVNGYWRSLREGPLAGRVLLSKRGREYRAMVGVEVMRQRVPRHELKGRLGMVVMARPPDRRVRDLDNLWKGLLDSLVHAGVVEDDGAFDDLRIYRGPVTPGGLLEVELRTVGVIAEEFCLPLSDPILDAAAEAMGMPR